MRLLVIISIIEGSAQEVVLGETHEQSWDSNRQVSEMATQYWSLVPTKPEGQRHDEHGATSAVQVLHLKFILMKLMAEAVRMKMKRGSRQVGGFGTLHPRPDHLPLFLCTATMQRRKCQRIFCLFCFLFVCSFLPSLIIPRQIIYNTTPPFYYLQCNALVTICTARAI